MREQFPKLFEIPFNSRNKFQLSIHKNTHNGSAPRLLLIKGAPEKVVQKCDRILIEGQELPMDDVMKGHFEEAYETLAAKGERVLGFGQLVLDLQKFPPTMDDNYNLNNIPEVILFFLFCVAHKNSMGLCF